MICPNCREEIRDGHSFCGNCGKKLPDDDITVYVKSIASAAICYLAAAVAAMYIFSKLPIEKKYYDYPVTVTYFYLFFVFAFTYWFYAEFKVNMLYKRIKTITGFVAVTLITLLFFVFLPIKMNYFEKMASANHISRVYLSYYAAAILFFRLISDKAIDMIMSKLKPDSKAAEKL